jgi:alkylation response protein AidB-like acyl-CoA dehydrogenase
VARLDEGGDFVLDAGVADLILCVTPAGIVPVERGAEGLTIRRTPSIDETRKLYNVSFRDPSTSLGMTRRDVIRYDAAGLGAAIDLATVALCAEMVGGMQWVLDATVEYAKTRKQFGKPIGQFQAVQHHCANMLLMSESARSAVYYAAWLMGNDLKQASLAVSMAKVYASDSYREVGNLAVQVHGGIGFTWDENIHFYYKRAKASEIIFGDANYHRERIARLLVDRAGEPAKSATGTASD